MPLLASLCLILLSSMATAIYFILITKLMRSLPFLSSNFFLCVTNYTAALMLLFVWFILYRTDHISLPGYEGWGYFMVAACPLIISRELYFYAYSRVDVAYITVFSALTPIYALLTGYLFLHEVPTASVICGIALVTSAIYVVFLPHGDAGGRCSFFSLQPFRRALHSLPVACGFLSTIPTAFAAAYQKKALYSMDITSFSLCLFLLTGTTALLFELVKGNGITFVRNLGIAGRPSFWCIGILLILMHICFGPLLMNYHSAAALTLQRSSMLFQIILAYFFLNQKDDVKKRVIAGSIILLGLAVLWCQV